MNRPQQERESIEAAKMQFIAEWRNGDQPTVQQYITRYPMFAQELTEFILTFIEMERMDTEESDTVDSSLLARALARAKAAQDPTLMELAKTSGITMPVIEDAIALPGHALVQIFRGQVYDPSKRLIEAFARTLRCAQEDVHAAFQKPVLLKAVVGNNYRARDNGGLKIPPLQRKSFRQLLEECPELTPEQREWWLSEED